jgi:2-keto-4-pentenoate hydratase/2-oxohepta-3-ene-1,7-dioic acid hydratase in catechol pathway
LHIIRFPIRNKIKYGSLEGNIVRSYRGSPFTQSRGRGNGFEPDGNSYNLEEVKLLAPCHPTKIVCLGLNYHSHAEEFKLSIPSVPLIFLKPSTAVIGPDAEIILPRSSKRVDYEGELAIVIGKKAKDVPEGYASEFVLGYTCFNDVSERYNQKEDGQWTRAKGYDTFAPLGPCIDTETAPDNLRLETYLNGELRQSTRTSDLIFGIPRLISFISNAMTLLPGDVIATGTTSGVGQMKPGDVVEVKIESIGTLRNFVIAQN